MAVYDVFLSYRRSDGSDLAKDLYQKLQRAGLRVFFDQSEMVDGHYFNTQISAALKQAPNYILVATPEVFPFRDEAQESDWVKKEIELAFEQYEQDQQNRSLNILMLPGTELPAESSLPESLKNLDFPNRINISWSLQSSELQRILKAVCHVNRRNIWHAAHRWLEESKQPGHRFASLHVNESIMPQAKHHKEDCQDQTTFPIHVSKEANDMQKQEIPLLDALRETSGHLYLIGQGGIGKTTALMHIMEAAYHEKQYTETAQIPIFIELSRAPDTEGRLYDGITSTYIRRSVYQQIREDLYVKQVSHSAVREVEEVFDVEPSVAVKPVEELFLAKQDGQSPEYLLLLDGLNEVSHTEVNELPVISRIIREIQWLMDCPNVRVILTSRTDEEAVFHENISRLYLTGIQNEALRDYLQKSKHEEEIDAIFQNEPLLETLRIPLFLMMYAGLGQTKDVSSQGEILRIFFHEREQNLEDYTIQTRAKQVEQDVATASPKQSSVRITAQMQSFLLDFLLPEIAWAMERSDTFYLDTETIEEIIAPILTDKSDTAICGKYGKGLFTKYRTSSAKEHTSATAKKLLTLGDDTLEVTESLIDIATRSLGILQERNGTYGFIHHHIRDYFAAARHVVHLRLAVYLQEKGSEQALTCLDDLKPEPIHLNIRCFIGEMLGEHHNAPQCINGTWTEMVPKEDCDRTLLQRALFLYRNRFDEKNDYSVFTLISILKEVRVDLAGIDFSLLDLENCSLNGVNLEWPGIFSNIYFTKISARTFFQSGHEHAIQAISCSPNGYHVVTGSSDYTSKIWHLKTGDCVKTLRGHKDWIRSVCYNHNGQYIVTGSNDKTARIWDSETGSCVQILEGHGQSITSTYFSPDGRYVLTASDDKTAKIWDPKTGTCKRTLNGHTGGITSALFSFNGRYIATGSDDRTARIWNTKTGTCIRILKGHDQPISSIDYSPNGHFLLTASIDGIAKLWDVSTGICIQTLKGNTNRLISAEFSPSGHYIITGCNNGILELWTLMECKFQKSLSIRAEDSVTLHCDIRSVTCTADERYIISGSDYGNIKLWDIRTGICVQTLKGCMRGETTLCCNPKEQQFLVGCRDGTARIWNLKTGICMQTFKDFHGWITASIYSPNGRYVATMSKDGFTKIWDVSTGVCIQTLDGCRGVHKAFIRFTPDSHYIIAKYTNGSAKIWNILSGVCTCFIKERNKTITSACFSPDGHYIIIAFWDNSVKILDASTGICVQTLDTPHEYGCNMSVECNQNGSFVITGGSTVKVWDIKTGICKKTLELTSYQCPAKYSPDGNHILTGSFEGTTQLWDANTGSCLQTLDGNIHLPSVKENCWINDVAFTPDGHYIISTFFNGISKAWEIDTGKCINIFPNIPGLIVQGVDFRHIHPNSSLDEEHRELLRRYGAIID